jgi:hypothetical protein
MHPAIQTRATAKRNVTNVNRWTDLPILTILHYPGDRIIPVVPALNLTIKVIVRRTDKIVLYKTVFVAFAAGMNDNGNRKRGLQSQAIVQNIESYRGPGYWPVFVHATELEDSRQTIWLQVSGAFSP